MLDIRKIEIASETSKILENFFKKSFLPIEIYEYLSQEEIK